MDDYLKLKDFVIKKMSKKPLKEICPKVVSKQLNANVANVSLVLDDMCNEGLLIKKVEPFCQKCMKKKKVKQGQTEVVLKSSICCGCGKTSKKPLKNQVHYIRSIS